MIRTLSACAVLCSLSAFAQEQVGLANSNYAGTDAIPLNPARMAGQWPYMDINLIGANLFAWNDHVFLARQEHSFWGDIDAGLGGEAGDDFTIEETVAPGGKEGFDAVAVKGPAVAVSLGKASLGAHITTRQVTGAVGISPELARFMVNGLGYVPQHGTRYTEDHIRLSAAAWTEVGLSYARILYGRGLQRISAGATVKYLMGHGAVAAQLDELDYMVIDTARATVYGASGSYAFSEPAVQAGSGAGVDLGFTFERTLEEADRHLPHRSTTGCDPLAYRWRAGLSVLDLGGISFNRPHQGSFSASQAHFPDYGGIQVDGIEGMDSLITASFSNVSRGNRMVIGLPTALSGQFDLNVRRNLYLAVDAVQNIASRSSLRLRRPNTLAVVPRFETRRFEVAVPVVLHEYDPLHPSVGLMIRLNSVVIGSDHVLPMLARTDIYGLDLYFRIKWTIFKGPWCNGKKTMAHTPGGRDAIPCTDPRENQR